MHGIWLLAAALTLFGVVHEARADVLPPPVDAVSDPVEATPPQPAPAPAPVHEDAHEGGFAFGSYGRVVAAGNMRGGSGQSSNIVSHGSRLDENTYAELELRRDDRWGDVHSRIVSTLAIAGPLFHFTSNFSANIAVRNLYAEASDVFTHGLAFWAGSRMVRGDDIYLLDYWPLDNLNLVGGGARYALGDSLEFGLHAGLARPVDPFYTQTIQVASTTSFVPVSVVLLDRPRLVVAEKVSYWLMGREAQTGIKLVLYNELHFLGAGTRQNADGSMPTLPSDSGYVIGAQIGAYDAPTHSFINVFGRYAQGLASYDPLSSPFASGSPVITTSRARDLEFGFSANFERGIFGVQAGGLFRYFRDADPNAFAGASIDEATLIARPMVWLGNYFGLAAEVGYQHRDASSLDPITGKADSANAFKMGLIPFISPAGRGTYTRPHIRILSSATWRDAGARRLYSALDERAQHNVEYFLGIGAEWWFNSGSYQ